ncbi:MAG: cysteine hydrolase [Acidobacteriaceae bacterium]|nr:cysteine hydrolase [Acidobacteriaceae bacterium]
MPRKTTELHDAALLFADLQPVIVDAGSRTMPPQDLTAAVSTAVSIADKLNLPVIASAVRLTPKWRLDMIDPLRSYPAVIRETTGMLDDKTAIETLRQTGRKTLAVGGVSSEIAVLHSVLGALREGYDVHILADCCGGFSPRTEDAAFRQMEAAGATFSSVSSFFTGLTSRMDQPAAQVVFSFLGRHWSWDLSAGESS